MNRFTSVKKREGHRLIRFVRPPDQSRGPRRPSTNRIDFAAILRETNASVLPSLAIDTAIPNTYAKYKCDTRVQGRSKFLSSTSAQSIIIIIFVLDGRD